MENISSLPQTNFGEENLSIPEPLKTNFGGWNLSQRVEDPSLPYPPLGQWEGDWDDCPEQNDSQAILQEGGVSIKPAKRKD